MLAWFNEILVFILASYTEECIWCLLTGGYFAKSFDPINNLNSFNCIKPLANNTSFDLSNFTISNLENCNAQKISMANPLISTSSFCDSSFYSIVKAINQTLNEDRPTYNRDFIRKFIFLKRFKGEWPLKSNHEYFFSHWSTVNLLADCTSLCRNSPGGKFKVSRHKTTETGISTTWS